MSGPYNMIGTLASGTMKVYVLPEGQGLDRRNDMAFAFGSAQIIASGRAQGESINLHSALSYGCYMYCLTGKYLLQCYYYWRVLLQCIVITIEEVICLEWIKGISDVKCWFLPCKTGTVMILSFRTVWSGSTLFAIPSACFGRITLK